MEECVSEKGNPGREDIGKYIVHSGGTEGEQRHVQQCVHVLQTGNYSINHSWRRLLLASTNHSPLPSARISHCDCRQRQSAGKANPTIQTDRQASAQTLRPQVPDCSRLEGTSSESGTDEMMGYLTWRGWPQGHDEERWLNHLSWWLHCW